MFFRKLPDNSSGISKESGGLRPPKTPFEEEQKIELTPAMRIAFLKSYSQRQIAIGNNITYWKDIESKLALDETISQNEKQFWFDFVGWLLGKGTDTDHNNTKWGRIPLKSKEILDFVDSFYISIIELQSKFKKLEMYGPKNLQETILYYKYFVRGNKKFEQMTDISDIYYFIEPPPPGKDDGFVNRKDRRNIEKDFSEATAYPATTPEPSPAEESEPQAPQMPPTTLSVVKEEVEGDEGEGEEEAKTEEDFESIIAKAKEEKLNNDEINVKIKEELDKDPSGDKLLPNITKASADVSTKSDVCMENAKIEDNNKAETVYSKVSRTNAKINKEKGNLALIQKKSAIIAKKYIEEIKDLKEQVEDLKLDLIKSQEDNQALKTTIRELETTIHDQRLKIVELIGEIHQKEYEIKELIERGKFIQEQHEKEIKELKEKHAEDIKALEESIKELEEKHRKEVLALNEQIYYLENEIVGLKTDLKATKEKLSRAYAENEELREIIKKKNEEIEEIRKKAQDAYDKLKKEKDEMEAGYLIRLKDLHDYVNTLVAEKEKIRLELAAIIEQYVVAVKKKDEQIKELSDYITELRNYIKNLGQGGALTVIPQQQLQPGGGGGGGGGPGGGPVTEEQERLRQQQGIQLETAKKRIKELEEQVKEKGQGMLQIEGTPQLIEGKIGDISTTVRESFWNKINYLNNERLEAKIAKFPQKLDPDNPTPPAAEPADTVRVQTMLGNLAKFIENGEIHYPEYLIEPVVDEEGALTEKRVPNTQKNTWKSLFPRYIKKNIAELADLQQVAPNTWIKGSNTDANLYMIHKWYKGLFGEEITKAKDMTYADLQSKLEQTSGFHKSSYSQ